MMLQMAFVGLFIIFVVTIGRAVEKFVWNGKEYTLQERRAVKEKLMDKFKDADDGDKEKKIKQKDDCKENGDSCWEKVTAE